MVETSPAAAASPVRALELDGIRGWASLSVMLYHVFMEMLGHVVPGLQNHVTYVLFNGEYAVMAFFILSGDALSTSFFAKGDTAPIDRLVIKRYFRLTLPVFLSCLGVYALMRLGQDWHRPAMYALHNEAWFSGHLNFEPALYHLLSYSFMDVYTNHTAETSFNPFLWTMSIEMVGSMIVFLYCYVWGRLRHPARLLCVVAAWLWLTNSFYFTFVIGMLFAYARHRGWVTRLRGLTAVQVVSWLALIAIVLFVGWSFQRHIVKPVLMAVAAVLVFSLYVNQALARVLSNRLSVYLGRLSFPLYLSHYWVLISLMSYLVLAPTFLPDTPQRLLIIGVVSALSALVIAHLFSVVEQWYLRRIDRLLNRAVIRA